MGLPFHLSIEVLRVFFSTGWNILKGIKDEDVRKSEHRVQPAAIDGDHGAVYVAP